MKYVDAAYTICLAVLFLYGVSVVLRRWRLLRADARRATALATWPPATTAPPATPPLAESPAGGAADTVKSGIVSGDLATADGALPRPTAP